MRNIALWIAAFLLIAGSLETSSAAETSLASFVGVTRDKLPLRAEVEPEFLNRNSSRCRVLIVGGLDGSKTSEAAALAAWSWFRSAPEAQALRERLTLAVLAAGNPEGLQRQLGAKNSVGGNPSRGYPPAAKAYDDPQNPESIYLWRSIGLLAPDVVVVVEHGAQHVWQIGSPVADCDLSLATTLQPRAIPAADELVAALTKKAAAEVGLIPAIGVRVTATENFLSVLGPLLAAKNPRSPARIELLRRVARSPIQVAEELSAVYGQQLNEVAYIPALALIGRLRLGELTQNEQHRKDVERIVEPYRSAAKPTLGKGTSGSTLSGHLVFGELADRTHDVRFIELTKVAADLGFDATGKPLKAMPFHAEMSDAVFMGTPILAQTGRLTRDPKYAEMALRHLRFMVQLNQRPDGLHQHSPVDPERTAWGRGNGFVTLGLALTLSELPDSEPQHDEVLKLYREHLAVMLRHQDELGMWHQVVDHPESYRELTVTCMTTFSIVRGLRRGWLDRATYEPVVRRAWSSIKTRVGPNGSLVDVCTGTGKMKSLREYFDRPANFGKDDRGGAMVLLVATELGFAVMDASGQ